MASKTTKEALEDLERKMQRTVILLAGLFVVKLVIDILLIVELLRS